MDRLTVAVYSFPFIWAGCLITHRRHRIVNHHLGIGDLLAGCILHGQGNIIITDDRKIFSIYHTPGGQRKTRPDPSYLSVSAILSRLSWVHCEFNPPEELDMFVSVAISATISAGPRRGASGACGCRRRQPGGRPRPGSDRDGSHRPGSSAQDYPPWPPLSR